MDNFRTPMRRARGLGAAKHGVNHWLSERLSAAALVPLVLWALWSVLALARTDFTGAVVWLQSPINAVLVVLLTAIGFWHMQMGMRVIIEDYISKPGTRLALTLANLAVCGLVGTIAVFCLLKVALTGGGF